LRALEHSKGVSPAGDIQICVIYLGDLNEQAVVLAALVQLTRAVQKARSETHSTGHMQVFRHQGAHPLQQCPVLIVPVDVRHDRDIVPRLRLPEKLPDICCRVGHIGNLAIDRDLTLCEYRLGIVKSASFLIARQRLPRPVLGLLHIGLVKGVDT